MEEVHEVEEEAHLEAKVEAEGVEAIKEMMVIASSNMFQDNINNSNQIIVARVINTPNPIKIPTIKKAITMEMSMEIIMMR